MTATTKRLIIVAVGALILYATATTAAVCVGHSLLDAAAIGGMCVGILVAGFVLPEVACWAWCRMRMLARRAYGGVLADRLTPPMPKDVREFLLACYVARGGSGSDAAEEME